MIDDEDYLAFAEGRDGFMSFCFNYIIDVFSKIPMVLMP